MIKKFLGLQYPLVKTPRGILAQKYGVDQIKADLLQLLLTNPGERCLTGDTLIPLANGTEWQIKDLVGQDPFYVYSYSKETDSIVAGKAMAFKTVENSPLVQITLDNNQAVRCTPDHLWMLRNGDYCRSDQLTSGMSLMPLYRNLNTSKYERVYQPYLGDYRETHLCFVEGRRQSGIREVVHHVDLDKRNNDPSNLQWMTCKEHKELHKIISNAFQKKLKDDPDFRKMWIGSIKSGLALYYQDHEGNRSGSKLTQEQKDSLSRIRLDHYNSEKGQKTKDLLREKALKQFKEKGHPSVGRKHSEESKEKMRGPRPNMSGNNNPSKRPEVREKIKSSLTRRYKNHKVLDVKFMTEREDCYDLHVEKYHNFAVSAGVFVHNCMMPEFGVPLRDLLFEQNDSFLEVEAQRLISSAIERWEPRVVITGISVSAGADKDDLSDYDDFSEQESILYIRIEFVDPQNIQQIEALELGIPLGA